MCTNKQCPSRESCLRFKGKANELWQSYADYQFGKTGKCDSYIPIKQHNKDYAQKKA